MRAFPARTSSNPSLRPHKPVVIPTIQTHQAPAGQAVAAAGFEWGAVSFFQHEDRSSQRQLLGEQGHFGVWRQTAGIGCNAWALRKYLLGCQAAQAVATAGEDGAGHGPERKRQQQRFLPKFSA